jgi:hypothetical protein
MKALLFQIQLLHLYFRDGLFKTCAITADDKTRSLLAQYGLVTRMQEGMYGCYAPRSSDVVSLLDYLNTRLDGEPFRFLLVSDSAQFSFMTELPRDWVGQVMFDSHAHSANQTEPSGTVRLAPTLASRTVDQPNVIGVVSIHLDDLLHAAGTTIRYSIEFHARSLPWRYYLVNRSQTRLNAPAIRDKSQFYLNGPDSVLLPNGETGLCFSSGTRAFPLQQVPTRIFDLIDRMPPAMDVLGPAVELCLISGLPTPSNDQIKQAKGGKDVFGAMYVYL